MEHRTRTSLGETHVSFLVLGEVSEVVEEVFFCK